VSWDGNPFEYSFDLKGSTSKPQVRTVVDVTQLRSPSKSNPLSVTTTKNVIDWLSKNLDGFDDAWASSLWKNFDYSHLPAEQQLSLISKVGHQTPMILGFDIHDHLSSQGDLSGLTKIYFTPSFPAAAMNLSRWKVICQAIEQIPEIQSHPNVLRSLMMIDDYLAEKPQEWQDGARFLATDFAVPEKARIKIYMRCLDRDFDAIWDYYTLGGRIIGLD
jgi:DMATS type aromatic prenyltransferase